MEAGRFIEGAAHLEAAIEILRGHYSEDDVELGHEYFKLAQCYFNGGDLRRAIPAIASAKRIMTSCFGPDAELVRELADMERFVR